MRWCGQSFIVELHMMFDMNYLYVVYFEGRGISFYFLGASKEVWYVGSSRA